MAAEDLLVDNCSYWQTVEAIGKCLPQLDREPPLALSNETVLKHYGLKCSKGR